MATPAAISSALVLLLVAFTASSDGAATFYVNNKCPYTLYPAAITTGGGTELKSGDTWAFTVPAGTSGRIWPRTGCYFDSFTGLGHCNTGDCGGTLRCSVSGKPPATMAEFTLGSSDGAPGSYGISVLDGFNVPMDFSCCTGGEANAVIRCREPGSPDCNDGKYRICPGDSYYEVVFCPST